MLAPNDPTAQGTPQQLMGPPETPRQGNNAMMLNSSFNSININQMPNLGETQQSMYMAQSMVQGEEPPYSQHIINQEESQVSAFQQYGQQPLPIHPQLPIQFHMTPLQNQETSYVLNSQPQALGRGTGYNRNIENDDTIELNPPPNSNSYLSQGKLRMPPQGVHEYQMGAYEERK